MCTVCNERGAPRVGHFVDGPERMPVTMPGRKRQAAALSTALPSVVSAAMTAKPTPAMPTGDRHLPCHTGAKDANGRLVTFKDAPSWFRPTLTPREMLLKGMHGGIYFNPKGGKPGVKYPRSKFPKGIPGVTITEYPSEWFAGVAPELYSSRRYDTRHNCYGVKSGLDQAGWESSGWINQCDPRGWTQWYFRFYMGRRLKGGEDERQMGRWKGVCGETGRWKQNLIAKCLREGKAHDDISVSPVVRQTLLHWAYELTLGDFGHGAKRVKTHGAAYVPVDSLKGVLTSAKGKKRAAADSDDEEDGEVSTEAEAEKAKRTAAEREKRAAKRQAAGTVTPGERAAVKSETPRGVKTEAPTGEEEAPTVRAKKTKKAPVKGSPQKLSAYERARDEQRQSNEGKLKELGLM